MDEESEGSDSKPTAGSQGAQGSQTNATSDCRPGATEMIQESKEEAAFSGIETIKV